MKEKKKELLRPAQVSFILGISEKTVKQLAKDGELPCIYHNRAPRFELDKLIEKFENLERGAA